MGDARCHAKVVGPLPRKWGVEDCLLAGVRLAANQSVCDRSEFCHAVLLELETFLQKPLADMEGKLAQNQAAGESQRDVTEAVASYGNADVDAKESQCTTAPPHTHCSKSVAPMNPLQLQMVMLSFTVRRWADADDGSFDEYEGPSMSPDCDEAPSVSPTAQSVEIPASDLKRMWQGMRHEWLRGARDEEALVVEALKQCESSIIDESMMVQYYYMAQAMYEDLRAEEDAA